MISSQAVDQDLINNYLQDTTVKVVLGSNSSAASASNYNIPVPALVPNEMVVAVIATAASNDKYWVAKVLNVKSDEPLTYNLRYYSFSKAKKGWMIMRGTTAYGSVAHSAIMVAGLEFNQDLSMKASSVKRISHALTQQ